MQKLKKKNKFYLTTKSKFSLAMFFKRYMGSFYFETKFYADRQNGIVTDERLSELMDPQLKEKLQRLVEFLIISPFLE